jgi:hypothetical protein
MNSAPSASAPSVGGPNIGSIPTPQYDVTGANNTQYGYNANTATATQGLNSTNQVTPYGSLTYGMTGGQTIDGQFFPQYTATQTLNPADQATADMGTDFRQGAQADANTLQNQIGGGNVIGGASQYGDSAYNDLMSRQNQQFGIQTSALQQQLANQGVMAGSTAYQNAFIPLEQSQVDASNQAEINATQLGGMQQQQDIAGNQANLGDMAALYGMGAGAIPGASYVNTPQTSVQPVNSNSNFQTQNANNLQAYGAQAQGAMAGYQAQMQEYLQSLQAGQATQGGLFGLGGSVLGGASLAAGASAFGPGGIFGGVVPTDSLTRTGNSAAQAAANTFGPVTV